MYQELRCSGPNGPRRKREGSADEGRWGPTTVRPNLPGSADHAQV
jgi:hypothetical protein